ncbi:MAG: class I SAM-dependent methyltransferase [Alphaproteobacteria bacterium]
MSNWSIGQSPEVLAYLETTGYREPDVLRALRQRTEAELGRTAMMQISALQGAFMAMLVKATGARRLIEVGTFTGYSALACALALPDDGRIVACDVSEEWTAIGRAAWAEAGVADKIDLRIGPASETLAALRAAGEAPFDMAFIDADKENYDAYYEAALTLVRPNGLILVDNVLWSGAVSDPAKDSESTLAIRALNEKVHADPRVEPVLLPIGDGLTLARVR